MNVSIIFNNRNGVARYESVMELRNYLEHLGTMEGANKDEKGNYTQSMTGCSPSSILFSTDPEEFLNMLFKKVLHVRPFISIR